MAIGRYTPMAIPYEWHITLPLLLHSSHVNAGMVVHVSRTWDIIVQDTYPSLGLFQKLAYVYSTVMRRMTTQLVNMFDRLAQLPTAAEIAEVVVASSSECFWGVVGSLEEDGRLWHYLDFEWRMSASQYHTHALTMAMILNKPLWLRALRMQRDSGILTEAQFTNMRQALYTLVLQKLERITAFHSSDDLPTTSTH